MCKKIDCYQKRTSNGLGHTVGPAAYWSDENNVYTM